MHHHSRVTHFLAILMAATLVTGTVTPAWAQAGPQRLAAGTFISLQTVGMVATQGVSVGDIITLTVVNDVLVGNRVVIKSGAPARAEVTLVKNASFAGIPGAINIRLQSVTAVDGTIVPVSATRSVEGDDNYVLAVVLGILCLPLIFVVRGQPAAIPAGSIVQASTNAEVEIASDFILPSGSVR